MTLIRTVGVLAGVPAVAAALVLATAGPVRAHAQFAVGTPLPPDSDATVALAVPHERDANTYNVKVVVAVPPGWRAVGCTDKPTWTCALEEIGETATISFVKAEGGERAEDESFEFTVHTPGSASLAGFPTQQVYNTGETINWSGAPGTREPAPELESGGAGAAGAPSAPEGPAPPEALPAPSPVPAAVPAVATAAPGSPSKSQYAIVAGMVSAVLVPCSVVLTLAYERRRRVPG